MQLNDTQLKNVLENSKNIAVIGLSANPEKTSHRIAAFLQEKGYRVFLVNPVLAGQEVLGEKVYASLAEVPEQIDIVDIFRRSEFLPDIAKEFVKTDAKVYWAQLGIENDEAAEILEKHHKAYIMNRCIKIEYQRLLED